MSYASGKHAYGISDRSGRRYRLREMKTEWTGAKVGPDEFEPKHPQLFPPRLLPDPQALRGPRPETELAEQRSIQYGFNPVGFREIPGITPPNVLVAEGQVGSVSVVTGNVLVTLTGLAATASVGSVVIPQSESVTLTGLSSTLSVGSVIISTPSASGISSTASVGTVTVTGDSSVTVTGLSSTASVGTAVAGDITAAVTGLSSTASVGTVTVSADSTFTLTGLGATGSVGSVTVSISASSWALASGSWSDSGVWDDYASWNDGS